MDKFTILILKEGRFRGHLLLMEKNTGWAQMVRNSTVG